MIDRCLCWEQVLFCYLFATSRWAVLFSPRSVEKLSEWHGSPLWLPQPRCRTDKSDVRRGKKSNKERKLERYSEDSLVVAVVACVFSFFFFSEK